MILILYLVLKKGILKKQAGGWEKAKATLLHFMRETLSPEVRGQIRLSKYAAHAARLLIYMCSANWLSYGCNCILQVRTHFILTVGYVLLLFPFLVRKLRSEELAPSCVEEPGFKPGPSRSQRLRHYSLSGQYKYSALVHQSTIRP